ncbi:PhzF family phenazine biosynthesis protein [Shimia marina]|uniref:Trans-2,3-dihydro-3-hydroxyanthranilate isomerase n=1 Tax=Shimia marina TaxID=321267 RepID=A0A0N7LSI4_9RHOB|nr:PhzF family phenazine biosynthesis protein [Shimia marina]CUH53708.1 Trans-2,3-dihydro-3-hydroxyanthranilate isomerase [Shimia marina]SFD70435.1 trans-2,3-dihydro-3-hydroxyanthranilate isomerase [Shimia marina]
MTRYFVYDVFTNSPFGGNPLAVIPDATQLKEDDLQRIAREFNFSETTFVFPPEDATNTARVRIFTPTMEIPFAGHPVIGTAVALNDMGGRDEMTLELGIGILPCKVQAGMAAFTTSAQLEILAKPDPETVAAALGISTQDIDFETHPPTMASLGLPFTLTRLKNRKALGAIETDVSAFRAGHATFPSSLDFAQFAYTCDSNTGMVHARMFAPLDNIPEDPATGSACATLGALLSKIEQAPVTLSIVQGEDMGRRSEISVQAAQDNVTVSGSAIKVMEGVLCHRQKQ